MGRGDWRAISVGGWGGGADSRWGAGSLRVLLKESMLNQRLLQTAPVVRC